LEQPGVTKDDGRVEVRDLGLNSAIAAASPGHQSGVGLSAQAQPSGPRPTHHTGVPTISNSIVQGAIGVPAPSAPRYLYWKGRVFDFDTGEEVLDPQPAAKNAFGPQTVPSTQRFLYWKGLVVDFDTGEIIMGPQPAAKNASGPQIHMPPLTVSRPTQSAAEHRPSLNSGTATASANVSATNVATIVSNPPVVTSAIIANVQAQVASINHTIAGLQSQLQNLITNNNLVSSNAPTQTFNTGSRLVTSDVERLAVRMDITYLFVVYCWDPESEYWRLALKTDLNAIRMPSLSHVTMYLQHKLERWTNRTDGGDSCVIFKGARKDIGDRQFKFLAATGPNSVDEFIEGVRTRGVKTEKRAVLRAYCYSGQLEDDQVDEMDF
jgi:hypothetical protein